LANAFIAASRVASYPCVGVRSWWPRSEQNRSLGGARQPEL